MTPKRLEKLCLGFAGAVLDFPFGPETKVFKVGGKLFALSGLRGDTVNLKCEPALAETLRETYGSVVPGYHMNKRHWNTVDLRGDVPDKVLEEMLEDSYDLVVAGLPKATQRTLGWAPAVDGPSG
jgi:predicted DNA-binding protein (MmcQ/YjbR family)